MNKIIAIFLTIILATIGGFAVLWATDPKNEEEQVQATQGIRLIGSVVYYNNPDAPEKNIIRVGNLLIGSNEQVYRINEIRKAQNGNIFVVVSWKYITAYKTYKDYQSQPYTNVKTYELNSFAYNKNLITDDELESFYSEFSEQIAKIKREQKIEVIPENVQALPTTITAPAPVPTAAIDVPIDITQKPQTYSTDEISKPEATMEDKQAIEELKELNTPVIEDDKNSENIE